MVLIENGWRVFRVTAKEVMYNIKYVISTLLTFLESSEKSISFGMLTNKEYNMEHVKYYCSCGNQKGKSSKQCVTCYRINSRKVDRPPYEQLLYEIKETSYSAVGRKYGVSGTAIRKWVKKYENNNSKNK